ncbi:hypothetical protein Tcan_14731 [Toxocara canis]|uniref:Uncharacterized protein n=1 Tax=Toxocara canis TaxID=6265 RepID=A0A0B2USZ4_TOXCA|nr:hypothetical protein Tcan_14731 [Toxocara canis]
MMILSKFSLIPLTVHNCFLHKRRTMIILLFIVIIYIVYYAFNAIRASKSVPLEFLKYQRLLKENRLSRNICSVPRLDPWDRTILKYYVKPQPLHCKSLQNNVTALQDGVLTVLPEYRDKLKCRCRTFEHNTGVSDSEVKYDDWVDVVSNEGLRITKEFVEVECYNNGLLSSKVYSYHWNQIIKRNTSIITKRPFRASSISRPSVLMFGVDSMSRSNFIRTLPKTYAQLQKLGFVDLLGHVKVGDNTFVNLGAMLTGKRSTATREFKNELPDEWNIYFDDWPFVWKLFSDEGYVTFFAEDRPDIGTFNYFGWLCGFKFPPTDHYFRPYWLASYWSLLFRRSTPGCYSGTPAHSLQLNYLSEFLTKYAGTRSFALHWTQDLSHDYLNAINVADEDYERFFIENSSSFNNTIVIVFSDHGHRYDAIRETIIGRLEARLPFASILLPKEFVMKYPHTLIALRENSEKMTTQFDFYTTLTNIALGHFTNADSSNEIRRAYNLLDATPMMRQCFEANIPEDYCPCFHEMQLNVKESEEAANELLNFINARLEQSNENTQAAPHIKDGFVCSKLVLQTIEYASIRIPPVKLVRDPQVAGKVASKGVEISYRVVIRVKPPSKALFEGVVVKDLMNNVWKVSGEIERNNKYGNTSHCVFDPLLKKLCHCISASA